MENKNKNTSISEVNIKIDDNEEIKILKKRLAGLERRTGSQKRKIMKLEEKNNGLNEIFEQEREENDKIYEKLLSQYQQLFEENLKNLKRNKELEEKIKTLQTNYSENSAEMSVWEYETRSMEVLSLLNPKLHDKIKNMVNPRKRKFSDESRRQNKRRRICSNTIN